MKILITGKDSYIGTSFEKWIEQYGDTYIVDTIDVRDDSWKQQSFIGYDAILHVAGIAHIKETSENSQLYYKVNRDLAIDLAVKAKKDCVKQFVFLSSMSVYGIEQGVITRATIPIPKSSYGKSKLEAEKIIHKLQDDSFSVATLRPPMVYGQGCRGNYPRLAKVALKLPVFPNIKNQRSMIHVDNLSEFIRVLLDDCAQGVFCPQNQEYVCTTEMVKNIADLHEKKIRLTKIFNPLLKLIRLNMITKVFGSLVYDKRLSEYQKKYCVYDVKKTISMTEGR
ncbi:MAG: NAD-dependent epimerase/dehydratase family protein [Cellulosilyticaceae bacterium]